MVKALIFDTETTGLVENSARRLADQPHVIEFFGLSIDLAESDDESGGEYKTYHSLFAHTKPLSKKVVQITGLTNDDLKDAPLFAEKAWDIKTYIESHDIAVAHNLNYDMSVLDFEFQRLGDREAGTEHSIAWPPRKICTVEATEHFKGYRLKLMDLHQHLFGEGFEQAHRAENDVRALKRIFLQLFRMGEI